MKSLRKSLNGKNDIRNQISTPLPAVSKPNNAITPPQTVIRALAPYRPNAPQELSFKKGDFFYLIKDIDGSWYEAHNPVTGARGIVPKSMFEELQKDNAPLRRTQIDSPASPTGPGIRPPPPRPPSSAKSNVYYAIVMHDFQAERADELDAKKGDAITVVAQSNREWFVAKPIGRLGRPGLIPVSFVEVHDPATGQGIIDIQSLMDSGALPKVEDWKRQMMSYKQNSIALGVLDHPAGSRQSVPDSPFVTQSNPPPMMPPPPQQQFHPQEEYDTRGTNAAPNNTNYADYPPSAEYNVLLPEGLLLSADVVTFHKENDDYWFRIDATFQPYPELNAREYPPSMNLILFRVYNDFYDFQVSLLDTFPAEAGRQPPEPRILPYMPGPANDVDDALSATRRGELDEYLKQLCELRNVGARHVLEHDILRTFLALKPGDVHNPGDPRGAEVEEILNPPPPPAVYDDYREDDYRDEIDERMDRLRVDSARNSDGSAYEDEDYASSAPVRPQEPSRHPYANGGGGRMTPSDDLRVHALSQSHHRNESNASFQQYGRSQSPYSRADSPSRSHSPSQSYSYTAYPERTASQSSRWGDAPPLSAGSGSSGGGGVGTRSRSGSTAALNNPPISATNSQTAFIKIKIFDRLSDDLIAIRVHPKVSHTELLEKVQARLNDTRILRYRDSVADRYVDLVNDSGLRAWMASTDRHVLYAD